MCVIVNIDMLRVEMTVMRCLIVETVPVDRQMVVEVEVLAEQLDQREPMIGEPLTVAISDWLLQRLDLFDRLCSRQLFQSRVRNSCRSYEFSIGRPPCIAGF